MSVDSRATDRRRRGGVGEEQQTVVRFVRAGWAVGAGMVLASDVVATCAHVVAEALGRADVPDTAPPEVVELDLPFLPGRPRRRAVVRGWAPPGPDGEGDIAVLRLTDPLPVAPPTLRRVEDPWGDAFRVAGFPPGGEEGTWASGEFRRSQASGWLQLDDDGGSVGPGFSGAPVWDEEHGCVAAMAVAAALADGGGAYAIPIDRVLALAPELLVNPYRGLAALGEDDAEFLFGRSDDLERSLQVLERTGLLVLAGGSGSGKSSLLAAGVVPAVRRRGRGVATARLAGADSAGAVVEGVAEALGAAGAELAVTWRARLRTLLGGGETDRLEHLHLVLVIDQFEDLAALVPDAARTALDVVVGLAAAGVPVALTARWATFDELRSEAAVADLQRSTLGITPLDRAGMRAAVAEPAARVPGPTFDAELVERIVDDAGDEPGRLPLVGALLAELWGTAASGRISVADYEHVGEVKGALATAAERAWRSLGPTEQDDAAAALQSMTRPTDAGFVRHPVVLASLRPGRRRVVERLAAERLVVVGPGPRGEVAELAHQALVDHWGRLRGWVEDDADFLRWRAQIRDPLDRWAPTRDAGALLRGADLETAVAWARRRGDDLEPAEREFVAAGAARRRRDRRIRLGAIAVVVVLALVASGLAVGLGQRNGQLGRALAIANARALAALSAARLPTDASAATQLALAAYAADPDGVDARDALGQAYLARHSTVGEFTPPGAADAVQAMTSDPSSGTTLVAVPNGALVVDGLGGAATTTPVPGASMRMRPSSVTPGGRFVVLMDQDGHTLVWDRRSAAPPRELPAPRASVMPTPDGTHVLTTSPTPVGTEVRLDDLLTGVTTPVLQLSEQRAVAWPTADPGRLLVRVPDPPTSLQDVANVTPPTPTLTVRDARSGVILATFDPTTVVAGGGRFTVGCTSPPVGGGTSDVLVVHDAASALETRRFGTQGLGADCRADTTMITADDEHIAWLQPATDADGTGAVRVQLAGLDDGRRTSLWVPRAGGLNAAVPGSPENAAGGGSRIRRTTLLSVLGGRAYLADGGGMDVLAPSSTPSWRDLWGDDPLDGMNATVGRDGSYVMLASARNHLVRVVDAATGAVLAERALDTMFAPGEVVTNFGNYDDQDVYEVTTLAPQGPRVHEFRLPTLEPLGTYDLGAAHAGGNGPLDSTDYPLQARTADRLAVLSDGVLSWWSTATHQLLAPPVVAVPGHGAARAVLEHNGGLTAVDPGMSAVVFRAADGVEQWALGASRPTTTAAALIDGEATLQVDHGHLRTVEAPGVLVSRGLVDGRPDASPSAVSSGSALAGNTTSGDVVSVDSGPNGTTVLSFWDVQTLTPRGQLRLPVDTIRRANVIDGRWSTDELDDITTVSVDPLTWRSALCAVQDRPFTDAERAVLPVGADTTAPCDRG